MRKRVLVTGGKGMLGSATAKMAAQFPQFEVQALGRDQLDVRSADAVARYAAWIEDGIIFHCAARVDVEGCAREPEAARETIVEGTRNVVDLARQANATIVYPQSFLVYDGLANPIAEETEPRPLSFYGTIKYEAEQIVREAFPDALIIRMAGFFGGGPADKNFVGTIIPVMQAAMARGERRFEVGDRVWQPTWTDDLARNSLHLMTQGATGTYQMACEGSATFADIAYEITQALGWGDQLEIVRVDSSAVSQSELGRRPAKAIMACTRLTEEGLNLQRPWRSTLHEYLGEPFFNRYRLEDAA
jgi:dTDP-4-dehydrorhamnose reductase